MTVQKPVWAEGVFLSQQHFQQWDNYWEYRLQTSLQARIPFDYGLLELVVDHAALSNATCRIKQLMAVLPNGMLVEFNEASHGELACQLVPNNQEKMTVSLAMPANLAANNVAGYQSQKKIAGFNTVFREVSDLYDAARSRELMFVEPNLQLLTDQQPKEAYDVLPILELQHLGDGRYQSTADYIPAVLRINAASVLNELVNQLIERLVLKSRFLSQSVQQRQQTNLLNTSRWLIYQTVNRGLLQLRHIKQHPEQHPERLYALILSLLGELTVFINDFSVAAIPAYQHHDLTGTFCQLSQLLSSVLDQAIPASAKTFALHKINDSLYQADDVDKTLLQRSQFFIGVYLPADNSQWIDQFARQVKVGATSAIDSILASALTGVRARHQQRPPRELHTKAGFEYFLLETNNEFWQQIVSEQKLTLFLPNAFRSATIELICLEE